MKVRNTASKLAFEAGQVWRMEGVTCHIGQVGKTLVNYKLLKDNVVRAPNSLSNQAVLAKHLETKNAVLMPSTRRAA